MLIILMIQYYENFYNYINLITSFDYYITKEMKFIYGN